MRREIGKRGKEEENKKKLRGCLNLFLKRVLDTRQNLVVAENMVLVHRDPILPPPLRKGGLFVV